MFNTYFLLNFSRLSEYLLPPSPNFNSEGKNRLPRSLIIAVIIICILPFILNKLGVNFASHSISLNLETLSTLEKTKLTDILHHHLQGSFTHTILEWSAFCTAIFTVILAFSYFWIQKDITTPIIGLALFFAGVMDAFHTLAADRLINAVADNQDLIPFTWAICRLFNGLITIFGVGFFLIIKPHKLSQSFKLVSLFSCLFGFIAYGIIHYCATRDILPKTLFPDSLLTRPWDVAPLVLFLIAGFWIYPLFDRRYPSLFSHGLIISTIPNVMTQIHMAFGSNALFDNHFNIGHFLKIIAYIVPLSGLILDYIYTHKQVNKSNQQLNFQIIQQQETAEALQESETLLKEKNQELAQTLTQLKSTQSQLIQNEKMSSLGQMVAGIAHEINNPTNFIYGNLSHLDQSVKDLLMLIEVYQKEYPKPSPQLVELIEEIELDFLADDIPKILHSMQDGATRIKDIVLSLRNFSRLDEAEIKDVDLHEGINSTLILLSNRIKQGIKINKQYGKLPLINCYPAQLNQVWMNLLSNGIDILEEKKKEHNSNYVPTITIITEQLESGQVCIKIKDNGNGIDPKIIQQIFDPFFTTKPVGKGTGLGLSICYQIIEKHQGTIEVNSQLGSGTEFIILLPFLINQI